MVLKGVEMGVVLALVAMIFADHGVMAQFGCTTAFMGVVPCLGYVTGNSTTPSSSCCSGLAQVVKSQPRCLCPLVSGGGAVVGFAINQTLALGLPAACNVQTPPVSECNTAGGSATSPTTSPANGAASSRGDSSDGKPDSPNKGSMPTAGSGSKSITGQDSGASVITLPVVPLILFLLFNAFCTSSLTSF